MEEQTVSIGQIYRIKATELNDITPKDGMLFRPKYSFLNHDSYIDCRKMKPVLLSTLLEGEYCGVIETADFDNIIKLIKMSPRETYVRLRTFGII